MNMFEEAMALRGMLDMCSLTQSEIAKKIGVSQSYVANKLRLLNFPEHLRKRILEAGLTERHARTLLKLKDELHIKTAIDKIEAMSLGVAASEVLVDNIIYENITDELNTGSTYDKINKFEEILAKSVKKLKNSGIAVKSTVDFANNKKYITICISE